MRYQALAMDHGTEWRTQAQGLDAKAEILGRLRSTQLFLPQFRKPTQDSAESSIL